MNPKPVLLSRKKARRFALQALYSWLVSGNNIREVELYFLTEHQDISFNKDYFHTLLMGVEENVEALDNLMEPYLSRKKEELDYIEKSILRLALYELQYQPDVPYKVVINEALELAKTFGATESYKFVNGVIDKVAKKIRHQEY